ncbi:MAG: DUF3168 domain-containing protein [Acidobacteriales bacterium]|nr:DUF3168 domain-containing protein [Terriglobales bacterium]
MIIEAALVAYLETKATVTSLVGSRIYPQLIPQGDENFPAIAYSRVSSEYVASMEGESGLARTSIALACWARSYETAKDLAERVRLVLDRHRGQWSQVEIGSVSLTGEDELLEASADDAAKRLYGVQLEFAIWHSSKVPQ